MVPHRRARKSVGANGQGSESAQGSSTLEAPDGQVRVAKEAAASQIGRDVLFHSSGSGGEMSVVKYSLPTPGGRRARMWPPVPAHRACAHADNPTFSGLDTALTRIPTARNLLSALPQALTRNAFSKRAPSKEAGYFWYFLPVDSGTKHCSEWWSCSPRCRSASARTGNASFRFPARHLDVPVTQPG